uniref:DUF2269 domain-containing protein n=1 Tax=Chlorobium chlorochromatii (strain CaD3) TaxID=340177 RepID=Q3AU88_CHLCH
MQKITPLQQKLLKAIHLLASGLWLSSVVVLLFLPIVAVRITSGDEIYMYNVIYHFIDMYLLTPAAILTFITGLIYSIFTKWGFFKHGWLVYKWIVTLLIIVVGTFYLGPLTSDLLQIADAERLAALQNPSYIFGQTVTMWAAVINTLLLSVALFFSVYKPWKR